MILVAVGQRGVVWRNDSPSSQEALVLRTWEVEGADVAPVPRDDPGIILREVIQEAGEYFDGVTEPRLLTVGISSDGEESIADVSWWAPGDEEPD